MTRYWISVRAVSDRKFTNAVELGATRYLRIPDDAAEPLPEHQVGASQWTKEILARFPKLPSQPSGEPIPTGDIAFLVHGYNNTVQSADQSHKNVQKGLSDQGFDCLVISFDWPSDGQTIAYLDDLDHAKITAVRLVNAGVKLFVRALSSTDCNIRVHVLGHSMGAFVLREAFDHADDGAAAAVNWTANQLVLFAGDVDARSFSASNAETESLYSHCYRLTNYFNRFDAVLQISNVKRMGVEPRVGRVGLPPDAPPKAVNVDCSDYFRARYPDEGDLTLTHSWYLSDPIFMKDLAITLRGAVDRDKIPTRIAGQQGAFALQG